MISSQMRTQSSQMKTDGPAISLRTSFCDLPQKEQFRLLPRVWSLIIVALRFRVPAW